MTGGFGEPESTDRTESSPDPRLTVLHAHVTFSNCTATTTGDPHHAKVGRFQRALYVMVAMRASSEYPTAEEAAIVGAAEQFMEETMAKFSDPSHDPHHGQPPPFPPLPRSLRASRQPSNILQL